jgi:hypothetical protein
VDVLLTIGLVISVILLIGALPTRKESLVALLLSAASLWATNILVFALCTGGLTLADRTNEISARNTQKDRSCFRR